jgi:hypothetical protein
MARQIGLSSVITDFKAWDGPWQFYDYVAQAAGLPEAERAIFEKAWLEATDSKHWRSSDLGQCIKEVEVALRERFPFLGAEAITAVANAAAY